MTVLQGEAQVETERRLEQPTNGTAPHDSQTASEYVILSAGLHS